MSSGAAAEQSRRVSLLSWDQVRRLDSILGESVPIHGRGNFPTLSVKPRQIVQATETPKSFFCMNRSIFYGPLREQLSENSPTASLTCSTEAICNC
ncbi:hypothetical protein GOODEAATRI_032366 [Goodea atripinnis]|uniref:polynucleotide adenylyltransferase n=1 Tax=Goodea atripinnis TaxID=208336 RepID=A0ABV0N603_9TELE